ncbi:MAG: hypothetical protein WAK27_22210 [Candidatus Sulfotelmatobacter sp.]
MATIKIPDRYKPGLAVLAALPEEVFNQVIATLDTTPSAPRGQKELTAWLSSEAKSVTPTDLRKLVDTLASLYRLRVKSNVTSEVLATDVADAASKDARLGTSADIVRSRLTQLLAINALNLVDAKARELQLEAEHSFCDARMITDIRPVFGSNVSDSPEAMIIVHTLKLGYHDSASQTHKEMYVALDEDDIVTLTTLLKRTQDKTKALKKQMASVGIELVDIT